MENDTDFLLVFMQNSFPDLAALVELIKLSCVVLVVNFELLEPVVGVALDVLVGVNIQWQFVAVDFSVVLSSLQVPNPFIESVKLQEQLNTWAFSCSMDHLCFSDVVEEDGIGVWGFGVDFFTADVLTCLGAENEEFTVLDHSRSRHSLQVLFVLPQLLI